MWSYYGAKTNIVDLYPKPKHGKIIEPFAGSARYALKYFDREVLLVDKYEVIVKIWKWLQLCSPADILKLPTKLNPGQTLDDFNFDCEEQLNLMGFLISKGGERPRKKPSPWVHTHRPNNINFSLHRIAKNINKIKHWQIMHGSYEDINNQNATWFIDPPYVKGGGKYVMSNKNIDFDSLSKWCLGRQGQVIVCESASATWLPFKAMVSTSGTKGKQFEGIYTNQLSEYDFEQLKIF